jgi:Predicted nucleotide-binding protein containing TIR-like domain
LKEASLQVGEAWSGSSIGYQARVYYEDFAPPPPGAHFSSEWGFSEAFSNYTAGDWREYRYRDVVDQVRRVAGNPDLTAIKDASARARDALRDGKAEAASLLTAALAARDDPLLVEVKDDATKVFAGTEQQFRDAILPTGQVASRDARALHDGLIVAPHFAVQAEILLLKAPFNACDGLAVLAQRAATHLNRVASGRRIATRTEGTAVVIGHGRSLIWLQLKDFVHDRLGLPSDEFNRVPVAGMTNIARLSEMLDDAVIALIVLTAEDERSDGSVGARQNVVHEVGLFQGRLGFPGNHPP